MPSESAAWKGRGAGEARFSKVLHLLHDKCLACQAMRAVEWDVTLGEEEKTVRLTALAHTIPELRMPSTGDTSATKVPSQSELHHVAYDSAWGHKVARPSHAAVSSRSQHWEDVLPKSEILERKLEDWMEERKATRALLKHASEGALLGALIADPSLSQRASVFGQNKKSIEIAVEKADISRRLSAAEKEAYSTAAAQAWELKRDLVRLEKMQESIRIRIDSAEHGYSVNRYNFKRCRDRRRHWVDTRSHPIRYGSLGLHKHACVEGNDEEEGSYEDAVDVSSKEDCRVDARAQEAHSVKDLSKGEEETSVVNPEIKPEARPSLPVLMQPSNQNDDGKFTHSDTAWSLFFDSTQKLNRHNLATTQEAEKVRTAKGRHPHNTDQKAPQLSRTVSSPATD